MWGDSWYLRRALATYEIHSAMLCSVFQIPALVVTRITRACENVILTSMAVYLFGKKILPHDLRRSYATNLLRKGINIKVISDLLGHENISTTSKYLYFSENEIINELKKI